MNAATMMDWIGGLVATLYDKFDHFGLYFGNIRLFIVRNRQLAIRWRCKYGNWLVSATRLLNGIFPCGARNTYSAECGNDVATTLLYARCYHRQTQIYSLVEYMNFPLFLITKLYRTIIGSLVPFVSIIFKYVEIYLCTFSMVIIHYFGFSYVVSDFTTLVR